MIQKESQYTNRAPSRGFVGGGRDEQNCALCTTAGALNLLMGKSVWTTDLVAGIRGVEDGKKGMGNDSTDEQARNIIEFVTDNAPVRAVQVGKMNQEIPYGRVKPWMLKFPDGTVFAMSVTGPLLNSYNTMGHWLNAHKVKGQLVFYDYQSNRHDLKKPDFHQIGSMKPASGKGPILGVFTQSKLSSNGGNESELQSTNQAGSFDTASAKCVVIAFTLGKK